MIYKITDIDDIYLAITRLTTHHYEIDKSVNSKCLNYATGFFYRNESNNKHFLVTSRHVIIDEQNERFPNVVRLYLHTDTNDLTKREEFDLHLYQGANKLWLESNVPNYDVVAIPLREEFAPNAQLTCFADNHFFPEDYNLSLAHHVMIIGYPLGIWYDELHNLPIIRTGIVSSAYPITYNGYPYFLSESRLHRGMSGAPVITAGRTRAYRKNQRERRKKEKWGLSEEEIELREIQGNRYLLGINSRTFPFPEKENSLDLNAIYFSYILKQFTT